MKHKNVLKRAWTILWDYKALWIFGIILALTTASYSPQSSYRFNNRDRTEQTHEFDFNSGEDLSEWFSQEFDRAGHEFQGFWKGEGMGENGQTIVNIFIAVICVIAILIPISRVFYYISETSLIKMVDKVEDTGEKVKGRAGFALGWSKEAWKLFLVDLVIFLPLFLVTLAVLALAAWPLFTGFIGSEVRNVIALVSSIGLFFLLILISIIVGTVIGALKHFIRRKIVLEQAGVFDAIREGSRMVFQNLKDFGLMWLINAGINIAWPIVLIPFVALLFGFGAVGGGLTALATYALSAGSVTAISIFGGSIFFIIMLIPLVFLGGLKATYQSTTWTLTYREVNALNTLDLEQLKDGKDSEEEEK